MKILLTGAGGMVGRNLLEHPAIGSHTLLSPSRKELDLCDYSQVLAYLRANLPDLVIHAAGKVGGIQANMADPVAFLLENLDMGRNLVWGARNAGIPRFLNLGSSCMYPRDIQHALREEMVLKGELEPTNEGYALAKVTTARFCQYITRMEPKFQYKTIIPCNLYGRHDKFHPFSAHLIPAVVRKVDEAIRSGSRNITIWGDGMARREFMYSGDLADALVQAVARFDELPDVLNVGLGVDHTVNEYYKAVADVMGFSGKFDHDLSKPVGMSRKLVSTERLEAWGWKAGTSLHEGILKTVEFYRKEWRG